MTSSRTPAEIRASLDHPIIDADGHLVEYWPELSRYFEAEGIEGGMSAFLPSATFDGSQGWNALSPEERDRNRTYRSPWWGFPNDARDLATATLPRLLHERMPELGMDFAICYPSAAMQLLAQHDETLRRKGARAYNRYAAAQYEGLGDRLIPVALIPTVTPEEALEELDFITRELGFRAAMLGGYALRRFDGVDDERTGWIDALGLDSLYDYDPVWRKLVELGITPAFHSGSMGWSGQRSMSNFSYNHMGHFGRASETTAKSLFFGGVLHRFPKLRVALLEGGVGWGVQMLNQLVEHFEKRGPKGLEELDPKGLDGALFDELVAKYAGPMTPVPGYGEALPKMLDVPTVVNDFEAAGITSKDDIVRQITSQCYFGCEADDPSTAQAFDRHRLPRGNALNPIFSSDIGHWDVAHMDEVVPEVYEHIEKGWLDADAFRAFACDNAARMYTAMNPDFFAGTAVEDYVSTL